MKLNRRKYNKSHTLVKKSRRIKLRRTIKRRRISKGGTLPANSKVTHTPMKRVFLSKKDNHKYFKEYIESICDGDEILLWDGNSILEPNRFYMCVGEVPRSKIPPSCKIAYINVEQLSDPARLNEYNSIIKDGIEIYDYSRDNIRISGKGTYLPYKENPAETAKLKSFMNVKKEYLVATVGNMSNRRTDIIKNIVSNGIMVKQVSGWEDDRDREIGKAHILLNIHHSDTYNIYEAIRCERWRFAGMPIVSEVSMSPMPEDIIETTVSDFLPKIVTKLAELVIPKKIVGETPTFHVVIATAGRPELRNMIDSLKEQLKENDALTVIFDGKSAKKNAGYTDAWTADMKCKVHIIEQIPGLKHYGHHSINKYLPLLATETTYVMFADDDDTYSNGAFDTLRTKCTDPDILYVAKFKIGVDTLIPPAGFKTIEVDKIGKVNGIIPFKKRAEALIGTTSYTGDFEYYRDLQKKVKGVEFLDDIIYLVNETKNAKNGNINVVK